MTIRTKDMRYMNTTKRLAFAGSAITLGVVLALAAVVTLNTPVHADSHPDLEVETPTVSDASLYVGEEITLYVTVTNAGAGDAGSWARLSYYRSTDSTITSSDTEQGYINVSALAAAASSDFFVWLTAPSEAGTYYYGACVDSVTDESDTTNNCSSSVAVTVSEPAPDLAVLGIDATDGVETGESLRIGVTVQNLGDGQSAATTLRWLQVTTGASDTELGTDAIRALNLLQANFETIRFTAPSTPGTYTYKACVDTVAGESDTTNNCRSVTVTVTLTNNLATGAPTISGTAQVGQTLTASTSSIADTDGLTNVSYSYQWLADDTDIDGATSSTYTLQTSDNGKTINVQVTFTDDAGNEESLISAQTNTVTVKRAAPPSTDATLSALTLSGIDFGTFNSTTTSYTAQVTNSVSQTTVTPTVNHSGASYFIKLDGVTDADGVISLSVGSNIITVEVTAEDDNTTQTYTITVTITVTAVNNAPEFAAATAERSVAENTAAGVDIGAPVEATDADNDTLTYTLGGDDMASFAIDSATGQLMTMAALDYEMQATYTVEVTATDTSNESDTITVTITVTDVDEMVVGDTLVARYDADNNGMIERTEVLKAINDYLFEGAEVITKPEVLRLIHIHVFG